MTSLPEMPCGPILELNGQRKRFHVPYGLKPLIDQMIRQVLRDQPENIYEHLACFLEARVKKLDAKEAEKNEKKSWNVHRWSWEASSVLSDDNLADFLQTLRTSLDEAEHHATVIQKTFRGHMAREKLKEMKNSKAGDFLQTLRTSLEEAQHHATVIQKVFRGHLAREKLKGMKNSKGGEFELPEKVMEGENEDESEEETDYLDDSEFIDEDGNIAGDEDEDYTETFEQRESEEEFETEMETISEMDQLADDMNVLTVKPTASPSKFELEPIPSKIGGVGGLGEEESETGEEETTGKT